MGIGVLPWLAKPALATGMPRPLAAGQSSVLAEALVGLLQQRSSAEAIGRIYLSHRPSDAGVEVLIRGICQGEATPFMAAIDDAPALKHLLKDRSRMDFVRGSTFRLEGCLMSMTELRWLALAALT